MGPELHRHRLLPVTTRYRQQFFHRKFHAPWLSEPCTPKLCRLVTHPSPPSRSAPPTKDHWAHSRLVTHVPFHRLFQRGRGFARSRSRLVTPFAFCSAPSNTP